MIQGRASPLAPKRCLDTPSIIPARRCSLFTFEVNAERFHFFNRLGRLLNLYSAESFNVLANLLKSNIGTFVSGVTVWLHLRAMRNGYRNG